MLLAPNISAPQQEKIAFLTGCLPDGKLLPDGTAQGTCPRHLESTLTIRSGEHGLILDCPTCGSLGDREMAVFLGQFGLYSSWLRDRPNPPTPKSKDSDSNHKRPRKGSPRQAKGLGYLPIPKSRRITSWPAETPMASSLTSQNFETIDVYGERGVVGCALHGATTDDLEPAWIQGESRRLLFLAADCLRHHGEWHVPESDHPAHMFAALLANAERVAHAVEKLGLWGLPENPRSELKKCLDGATMPALASYYAERIRQRFLKIQEITNAEKHLRSLVAEVN